jgi:hypothetical protein
MNNFTFVRRATPKDLDIRKSRIEKGQNKATLDQLQKISDLIIKVHNSYYEEKLNEFINKVTLQEDEQNLKFKTNSDKFNRMVETIISGVKPTLKCNCMGDLIYINSTYQMIGCTNYRDVNFDHFKMYKPQQYNSEWTLEKKIEEFQVSKHYLSDICKALSIKVKASDLYEFLILNKIKLHREDINREFFYTARNAQELSRKREDLIYSELSKKYDRLEKQLVIAYQYSYENFIRFAIPDVIVFDNKNIIIYEQKKSIENINLLQTELYVDLIKQMVDDSYTVIVKYVIEEDYPFMPEFVNKHEILTLNTL